jgi:hypothetical protein
MKNYTLSDGSQESGLYLIRYICMLVMGDFEPNSRNCTRYCGKVFDTASQIPGLQEDMKQIAGVFVLPNKIRDRHVWIEWDQYIIDPTIQQYLRDADFPFFIKKNESPYHKYLSMYPQPMAGTRILGETFKQFMSANF